MVSRRGSGTNLLYGRFKHRHRSCFCTRLGRSFSAAGQAGGFEPGLFVGSCRFCGLLCCTSIGIASGTSRHDCGDLGKSTALVVWDGFCDGGWIGNFHRKKLFVAQTGGIAPDCITAPAWRSSCCGHEKCGACRTLCAVCGFLPHQFGIVLDGSWRSFRIFLPAIDAFGRSPVSTSHMNLTEK